MRRCAARLAVLILLALAGPIEARASQPLEPHILQTRHPIAAAPVAVGGGAAGRWLAVVTSPDERRLEVELFRPEAGVPIVPAGVLPGTGDLIAVDAATIGPEGESALFLLTPGAVLRWVPGQERPTEIKQTTSIYRRAAPGQVTTLDFMRNTDGRDEPILVLPDFDQLRAGNAALPVPPRVAHVDGGAHYAPPEVHLGDLTLDGRPDLFLFDDDAILLFPGVGSGFAATGRRVPLGLNVHGRPRDDQLSEMDQSEVQTRRIVAVRDFDGDDRIDLLVEQTKRSGLLDRQTSHQLHFGRPGATGIVFDAKPDTVVEGDSPLGGIRTMDIDEDGDLDFAAGSIDIGLTTIVSALVTGTVDFDVHFFRLTDRAYPSQPDATQEARIEFDLSEGRASIPVLVLADVDGDGDRDLVMREERDELVIYPAGSDSDLFADAPLRMQVPLPDDGQRVQSIDANGDEADDLIVRYEGRAGEEAKRRLLLLLGRGKQDPRTALALEPR